MQIHTVGGIDVGGARPAPRLQKTAMLTAPFFQSGVVRRYAIVGQNWVHMGSVWSMIASATSWVVTRCLQGELVN